MTQLLRREGEANAEDPEQTQASEKQVVKGKREKESIEPFMYHTMPRCLFSELLHSFDGNV